MPVVADSPCAQRIPIEPRPDRLSLAAPPEPLAGATEPAGPCQLCGWPACTGRLPPVIPWRLPFTPDPGGPGTTGRKDTPGNARCRVSAYPGFRRVYGDAGAVLARRATGRKARRSSRAPLSAEERAAIRKAGADDARRSRVRQGLPDRIDDAAVIAVLADLLRTARSTPHPGTSQERKRRPEPHKRRAAEDIPRRSSSPRGRSGVASTAARVRCPMSNLP